MLQQEFGTLETLWELFTHGLFNHAGTGKADERLGFSNDHVANKGKGSRDAAHRRIRQHSDERKAVIRKTARSVGRLGHLHEGEKPFLHAGSAGSAEHHEGCAAANRFFHAERKPFTDDAAHGAAHETEFKGRSHHRLTTKKTRHHDKRICFVRRSFRSRMARRVGFAVDKVQRILGADLRADFHRRSGIQKGMQTHAGAHAEVIPALGANAQTPVKLLGIERLLAARTLRPYAFRNGARLLRGFFALDFGENVIDPAHRRLLETENRSKNYTRCRPSNTRH